MIKELVFADITEHDTDLRFSNYSFILRLFHC